MFFQLERAWNSLKWTEKLSLVTSVIRGITSPFDTRPSLKVCHPDNPTCSFLKSDKRGEREREIQFEESASLLKFRRSGFHICISIIIKIEVLFSFLIYSEPPDC